MVSLLTSWSWALLREIIVSFILERSEKSNAREKTRIALESFLPHDLWEDVNYLLVGFGQTICSAVKPKCEVCSLQSKCRYFQDPKYMKDV